MKKQLIGEFYNLADALSTKTKVAKVLMTLSGAIAITGVVFALSSHSERGAEQFFLDNGSIFQADRIKNVHFSQVEKAYPFTEKELNSIRTENETISTEESIDSTITTQLYE